jgi:uncharacterized DUF497 family protein
MPDWSRYEFAWNETNIEHIAERHAVYPEEAEQVFANRPHVDRKGDLYHAYGRSDDGYLLTVIFQWKAGLIRVITARPMSRSERRSYGRNR